MYLEKAKHLLTQEYNSALAQTHPQSFARVFIEEKIRHSFQVLGAGNYILKHEPIFNTCNTEQLDCLKATVLLHDIARFQEILLRENGIFIDHGTYGADMLKKTDTFKNTNITLPIKHHGHLIEELYSDPEYLSLPKQAQTDIKNICFLVRDADKLANFYLLANSFKEVESVFFPNTQTNNKIPVPEIKESFLQNKSINKDLCQSSADRALLLLAWIFDIDFSSSLVFLQKLSIIDKLFSHFAKFLTDEDQILYKETITKYITKKQQSL